MKATKLTQLVAMAGLIGLPLTSAHAYTVTTANWEPGQFYPVVDVDGNGIPATTTVYVGSFGMLTTQEIIDSFDAGTLMDDFTEFGTGTFGDPTLSNISAYFSFDVSASILGPDDGNVNADLIGKEIMILVMDETGTLVVPTGKLFGQDDPNFSLAETAPIYDPLSSSALTPIVGTFGEVTWNSVSELPALDSDFPAFQLAPKIPEPSTYALMGLGLALLGFVASRRRK